MRKARRSGFTLLEILVSMGIIGLLSVVMTQTLYTTARSNTKTEILKEVKQNGDFVIDVMSRMIRSSLSVTSSCSSAGTTTSSLTITNPDGRSTTFGCLADSGVTRVASTSSARTDFLTNSGVTAGGSDCSSSSLRFVCTGSPGAATSVQIKLTLAQKGTPVAQFEKASATFQTSVTLRNK